MTAVNNLTEDRIPQEIEEPINAFAVGVNHVGYTYSTLGWKKNLVLKQNPKIYTRTRTTFSRGA